MSWHTKVVHLEYTQITPSNVFTVTVGGVGTEIQMSATNRIILVPLSPQLIIFQYTFWVYSGETIDFSEYSANKPFHLIVVNTSEAFYPVSEKLL